LAGATSDRPHAIRVRSRPSRVASRATVAPWLKAAARPPTACRSEGIPTASPPPTDSAAPAVVIVASELLTGHSSGSEAVCRIERAMHRSFGLARIHPFSGQQGTDAAFAYPIDISLCCRYRLIQLSTSSLIILYVPLTGHACALQRSIADGGRRSTDSPPEAGPMLAAAPGAAGLAQKTDFALPNINSGVVHRPATCRAATAG